MGKGFGLILWGILVNEMQTVSTNLIATTSISNSVIDQVNKY